jgi:lauroyl/myristoyl acyltransferase
MSAPALGPHAPQPSRVTRLLGPISITGVFWYRLHAFGVRILPEWSLRALMAAWVTLFTVLLVRIRGAIAANLEPVLGPCGTLGRWRRAWRTLHDYAWCLSERYEQRQGLRRATVTIEGREHWDALLAGGRGIVFVTAHVGNWEVGSLLPADHGDRPVHAVREPEQDPRAQAFTERQLRAQGNPRYVTHFAHDDAELGLTLLRALRRGELVGLQGDRPRAGRPAVPAVMFGCTIALPPGPAALARAAQVPLVPVFVFREGRLRHRVVIRPPFTVGQGADRDADVAAGVQRLAGEIEWAIRQRPHHWFCFGRAWADGAGGRLGAGAGASLSSV